MFHAYDSLKNGESVDIKDVRFFASKEWANFSVDSLLVELLNLRESLSERLNSSLNLLLSLCHVDAEVMSELSNMLYIESLQGSLLGVLREDFKPTVWLSLLSEVDDDL
jgi:hypothetical protein